MGNQLDKKEADMVADKLEALHLVVINILWGTLAIDKVEGILGSIIFLVKNSILEFLYILLGMLVVNMAVDMMLLLLDSCWDKLVVDKAVDMT